MSITFPFTLYSGVSGPPLTLRVKTNNAGTSDDDQFTLQLRLGLTYDFVVTHEGNETVHNTDTDLVLTFSVAGTHDITITGLLPALYYNNAFDREKLLDIPFWGNHAFDSFERAFYRCNSMVVTATDTPDTSNCTNLAQIFQQATTITDFTFVGWDTSKVTSMSLAFYNCNNLNSLNMNGIDMSECINLSSLVRGCGGLTFLDIDFSVQSSKNTSLYYAFSALTLLPEIAGLANLDVSKVTNFQNVLNDCKALDISPVESWVDLGEAANFQTAFHGLTMTTLDLSGWVTDPDKAVFWFNCFRNNLSLETITFPSTLFSRPTSLQYMFYSCPSLQTLDLSSFDCVNNTTMERLVYLCTSLTSINLDDANMKLDSITNMDKIATNVTLDTSNYSDILIDWDDNKTFTGPLTTDFGSSQYSVGAATTARASLVTKGMTIIDGGQA